MQLSTLVIYSAMVLPILAAESSYYGRDAYGGQYSSGAYGNQYGMSGSDYRLGVPEKGPGGSFPHGALGSSHEQSTAKPTQQQQSTSKPTQKSARMGLQRTQQENRSERLNKFMADAHTLLAAIGDKAQWAVLFQVESRRQATETQWTARTLKQKYLPTNMATIKNFLKITFKALTQTTFADSLRLALELGKQNPEILNGISCKLVGDGSNPGANTILGNLGEMQKGLAVRNMRSNNIQCVKDILNTYYTEAIQWVNQIDVCPSGGFGGTVYDCAVQNVRRGGSSLNEASAALVFIDYLLRGYQPKSTQSRTDLFCAPNTQAQDLSSVPSIVNIMVCAGLGVNQLPLWAKLEVYGNRNNGGDPLLSELAKVKEPRDIAAVSKTFVLMTNIAKLMINAHMKVAEQWEIKHSLDKHSG